MTIHSPVKRLPVHFLARKLKLVRKAGRFARLVSNRNNTSFRRIVSRAILAAKSALIGKTAWNVYWSEVSACNKCPRLASVRKEGEILDHWWGCRETWRLEPERKMFYCVSEWRKAPDTDLQLFLLGHACVHDWAGKNHSWKSYKNLEKVLATIRCI